MVMSRLQLQHYRPMYHRKCNTASHRLSRVVALTKIVTAEIAALPCQVRTTTLDIASRKGDSVGSKGSLTSTPDLFKSPPPVLAVSMSVNALLLVAMSALLRLPPHRRRTHS
jgi:hypothetical protein